MTASWREGAGAPAISRRALARAAGAAAAGAALGAASSLAASVPARAATSGTASAADDAADTYDSASCFYEGYESCADIEAEGSVLLKNANDLLPLAQGAKVTVLGAMSYNYIEGGTGSAGGKDDDNTVMLDDALAKAGLDVNEAAWSWLKERCGGSRGVSAADPGRDASDDLSSDNTWVQYQYVHEFGVGVYEDARDVLLAEDYTDYALVTIARSGAEGAAPSMDADGDGSTLTGATYLELSERERDLLVFAEANFGHTILLVNSAVPMELGFIEAEECGVDACLWIGHPGEAGVAGVASLLAGLESPSGRLVDTWAYDVTTNPTYYNIDDNRYANCDFESLTYEGKQPFYQYEEGIYVGYRYFETAAAEGYFDSEAFSSHEFKNGRARGYGEVVQFPFGFGLSYTTFSAEISAADVALAAHGTNTVDVTVTNNGEVAGKHVVQLYMEVPYAFDPNDFGIRGRGLEKPKVVLVAFCKTDVLEPGASQTLTLSFATDDLASFDNFGQGCYVLERGSYFFNVQDNAHMWGRAGAANAAAATVEKTVPTSLVYADEGELAGVEYVGARSSDACVAANSLDDVTAGDGNMLDGYLSRSDFAGGMEAIMAHASDEEPNEELRAEAVEALGLCGTQSMEYSFETYRGGVKTTLTKTLYAKGADMMPFAEVTPDGQDAAGMDFPLWEQAYYVVDGAGDADGVPKVVGAGYTGARSHLLRLDDLAGVSAATDAGRDAWDKLAQMASLDEAIELQGNVGWKVPAVESAGLPQQKCQDGPGEAANGTKGGNTWFPCAVSIASTWNVDLAYAEGVAYGHQAVLSDVQGAYAPAMNLHRSPFGGRNFEYFSEDGLLSGRIGGSVANGIMSTGTNVFIKHCALNDGETNRGGNTTWACEQAIRELYMRPFEIAVKEFGANGIMGSLNRIGLSWYHFGLYATMLRHEWDWDGLLITDGDGADGDAYNSPQAVLCVGGAVLNNGSYINDVSTEAAFGDATAYPYAQQRLHNLVRNALYQYGGPHGVDQEGNAVATATTAGESSGDTAAAAPTATGAAALGAAALCAGALLAVTKLKPQNDK